MKVLAGVERATSGRLLLDGSPVEIKSTRDAAHAGIGIIFQELNLYPNLSISENIFVAREMTRGGVVQHRAQEQVTAELLNRLEQPLDPATLVRDLRMGQQQIVEIAKALSQNVRILIMDEPTSALTASETEALFRIIADLRADGVAIIYISHKLEELLQNQVESWAATIYVPTYLTATGQIPPKPEATLGVELRGTAAAR